MTVDAADEANSTKTAALGAAADVVVDATDTDAYANATVEAAQVCAAIVDRGSPTALQSACDANSVNAAPPAPPLAAPPVVAAPAQAIV